MSLPAIETDVDRLRRERFAADGADPDRQYYVYQYFAHRAFAQSLRDGTAPTPGFADAYNAHAIVEAGYRSAATTLPVELASLEA